MWTRRFWLDAGERALRTAAQTALGVLGADGTGLVTAGPAAVGTAAGLAALVSVLMSLVGSATSASDTASLLPERAGRHAA